MADKEIRKAKAINYIALVVVIILIGAGIFALYHLGLFSEMYTIRIVVPAGSTDEFVYSDEEISPKRNTLKVTAGDNMGDSEVILLAIGAEEDNTNIPHYITPGLTVEMDVEKGGWFQIGVNIQNPTDEDIIVYVNVYDVNLRIE